MSNKILKMPNKNLKTNGDIIVGLDIGTSKVVCLVGRYSMSGDLEIIALGTYPSSGLKTVSYTHLTLPTTPYV